MRTKFVINTKIKSFIPIPSPAYTKSAQLVDALEVLKLTEFVLECLRSEKAMLTEHPDWMPNVKSDFDNLTGIFDFSPDSLSPVMGAWRGFEQSLIEYGLELAKVAGAPTATLESMKREGATVPWWMGKRAVHELGHHPICDELFLERPF